MLGMEGEMLKGHLDMIVLAALASGPAHGYAVIEEIRRRSGDAFNLPEGTVYPALPASRRPACPPAAGLPPRAAASGESMRSPSGAPALSPSNAPFGSSSRRRLPACSPAGRPRDPRIRRVARPAAELRPGAVALGPPGSRGSPLGGRRGREPGVAAPRHRRVR